MRISKEVEIRIIKDNIENKAIHSASDNRQLQDDVVLKAPKGKKLLDLLRDNGISINSPCSGSGTCGKCRVKFLNDGVRITSADMKHISKEDLEKGYRLACMSILTEDAQIVISDYNEDSIVCSDIKITKKSVINTNSSDLVLSPDIVQSRGSKQTQNVDISKDKELLNNSDKINNTDLINDTDKYPAIVQSSDIEIHSQENDRIDQIDYKNSIYGIGIDLGTTTIAVALVKLPDGDVLGKGSKEISISKEVPVSKESSVSKKLSASKEPSVSKESSASKESSVSKGPSASKESSVTTLNPCYSDDLISDNIVYVVTGTNHQRSYGTDVISRIKASKEKGKRLKEIVVSDIEKLIQNLLTQTKCSFSQIRQIAVAGNTTMLHLLRGYNCESLGVYPYTPVSLDIEELKAGDIFPDLGDNANNIPVTILPGFSAFVGADILSGLYATRPWKMDHEYIFLDLGTNGEMAAGIKDKIYVTSTAAGPVFEGNGIRYGIPGIPGAIKGAEFVNGKLKVRTIGDLPPIGICGTGVLEIVSALVREKIVDDTGLFADEYFENGYPVCKDEEGNDIVITQNDIRQVQMAKAAVNVGLDLLYEKIKTFNDKYLSTKERVSGYKDKAGKPYVIISGGFGAGISFDRIKELKMFPDSLFDNGDNIHIAGNTSLLGTAKYLCIASLYGTKIAREELCMIPKMAKEIELSQDDSFSDRYFDAMNF